MRHIKRKMAQLIRKEVSLDSANFSFIMVDFNGNDGAVHRLELWKNKLFIRTRTNFIVTHKILWNEYDRTENKSLLTR